MKRKILYSFTLLMIFFCAQSQNVSSSPYSGFGLGEYLFDQSTTLSSQAGTSSAYISELGNEINFSNPAANHNLIYTTFNFGVNNTFEQLKAKNLSEKTSSSYISEVSLAMPIGEKFKFGIGFQPYTAVGYNLLRIDSSATTNLVKANHFVGEGGLNSAHGFVSYNIKPSLSVGLRLNYLFGNIDKTQEVIVKSADLATGYNAKYDLNALTFTTGIAYTKKLKEYYNLNLGATYSLSTNLDSDYYYLHKTYYYTSSNTQYNVDTIQYVNTKNSFKIPSMFSVGVSYGKSLQWNAGFEYKFTEANDFIFPNEKATFKNSHRFSLGGWYLPDVNSYKSYFNRMMYRFGAFYNTGAMELNGKDINQYGITFGTGLPIGKKGGNPSMLNIGFEFGKQGTTSNNLIQENYGKVKIGFNMNDLWFRKRKFN